MSGRLEEGTEWTDPVLEKEAESPDGRLSIGLTDLVEWPCDDVTKPSLFWLDGKDPEADTTSHEREED